MNEWWMNKWTNGIYGDENRGNEEWSGSLRHLMRTAINRGKEHDKVNLIVIE